MLPSLWNGFLNSFAKVNGEAPVIVSILKQLYPIELTEGGLVLGCGNNGVKIYVEKRIKELEGLLSLHLKSKTLITIVVQPKKQKSESPAPLLTFQPSMDDVFTKAGLHAKYRFENFAVSSTNNVAFAAAQAVSKNIGTSYNPLFLYGGVGVGKTHLAQSVARVALEKNPNHKVYFCPGDRFTNELIESFQDKSTVRFRKKYRNLNILAIDDIQFIAGKQAVQEEFFHTFNTIVSSGGQVILTSDRPPHEIKNLEDRLRSRFSGGLIVDIQSPDFELRTAILLIKAREKEIELSIDAAKVIAEQVSDTRALEGTLLSIYAKTLGKKEGIDLEDIEGFFQHTDERKKQKISPHDIIKAVCSYYNVKQSQIKSPERTENLSFPRQIIMFLLRRELGLKYEEIAHMLKKKDHTTVLHGSDKIGALLIKNPSFKEEVDRIIKSLSLST
ncbi:chromosomal replication initiator protein DnaA [Candidatus Roizmanbacteria bacterium]|nr:chromosomal replication initiator protein DnaA [Candidatus Roizmanbacteria bacterium]